MTIKQLLEESKEQAKQEVESGLIELISDAEHKQNLRDIKDLQNNLIV